MFYEGKFLTVKEDEQMLAYINKQVEEGWTNIDGAPLKCPCGCKKFHTEGEYFEEHLLVEYTEVCNDCKQEVGHFAYGSWDL